MCFVDNLLKNKTIILLNLAEFHLILANAAYEVTVDEAKGLYKSRANNIIILLLYWVFDYCTFLLRSSFISKFENIIHKTQRTLR